MLSLRKKIDEAHNWEVFKENILNVHKDEYYIFVIDMRKYKIIIKNNLVLENKFYVNVLRMNFTLL